MKIYFTERQEFSKRFEDQVSIMNNELRFALLYFALNGKYYQYKELGEKLPDCLTRRLTKSVATNLLDTLLPESLEEFTARYKSDIDCAAEHYFDHFSAFPKPTDMYKYLETFYTQYVFSNIRDRVERFMSALEYAQTTLTGYPKSGDCEEYARQIYYKLSDNKRSLKREPLYSNKYNKLSNRTQTAITNNTSINLANIIEKRVE